MLLLEPRVVAIPPVRARLGALTVGGDLQDRVELPDAETLVKVELPAVVLAEAEDQREVARLRAAVAGGEGVLFFERRVALFSGGSPAIPEA